MLTQDLFTVALNIKSPWHITNIKFSEENKRLDIYIDFKKGAKFTYGKEKELNVYDTKEKTWRHLNFFEHECYLNARVPRVKLKDGKVKLIQTPWEGLSNGFTLLFETLLMQLASAMPMQKVAKIVNESDDKLWTMLHRYVEGAREYEDFSCINKVGIDETARARRHKYISLFVDLDLRKTIFVTKGKKSEVIENFADDFAKHKGIVDDIEHVSMDMSKSFIKGVGEHIPNAKITFDKFHIMKIINEAVDTVRKEEVSNMDILKEARYTLLKNEENLTKKQRQKLNELKMSKENLKTSESLQYATVISTNIFKCKQYKRI